MDFETIIERATLLDPSGARVEQVIQHRVDPLTGTVASLNAAFGEKARAFLGAPDLELLNELQDRSRTGCPFCSAHEKGTRFTPDVVPEGQIRFGGAIAMPNLFSKCGLDAVVVIDFAQHVLFPLRISAEALGNAIRAVAEVTRRARARDAKLVHCVAGMNFLHPGGSSVPHPHLQVQVRGAPYSGVARVLREGAEFQARTGRSYWELLLERERELGARRLGDTGPVSWIAAFAPAHQKEVWGILPGKSSLVEIADADAAAFGDGISKVISSYEADGHHAFTLAFLSSPEPAVPSHALQVRLCARPAFKASWFNYDTWFSPMFAGDDAHTEAPEEHATRLRARW